TPLLIPMSLTRSPANPRAQHLSPSSRTSTPVSSLQRSRARRALHSFPTRRSSDLVAEQPIPTVRTMAPTTPRRMLEDRRTMRTRSEEHTSELQSRENLVCRLLLEKKNREDGIR